MTAAAPCRRRQQGPATAAAGADGRGGSGGAAQPPAPGGQQQYLYESKYGLPVVRKQLSYTELLKAIRLEEVKEVRFFTTDEDATHLEGPCLVVMNDGSVAQSFVRDGDYRMAYAMETHGVHAGVIPVTPTKAELAPSKPIFTAATGAFVVQWIPYFLVGLVYVATTYVRWKKGDMSDRQKLRKKLEEDTKRKAREDKAEQVMLEVADMARLGFKPDQIVSKIKASGFEVERQAVDEVVARVEREDEAEREATAGGFREFNLDDEAQLVEKAKFDEMMRESMAGDDPQAQAEAMLKMKTARIRKARDPIKARKQKEAQRQLKNIKLMVTDKDEDVFFDDVAGIGDAKVELQEIVDFFQKPEKFRASGSRIPRGVLLCGPPGTGKTLLARAVAGEAGATFIALNASEFVEMFVGVGASRVRDLFSQARAQSPAIIFIDEIDSVGRIRGGATGNDERDQTLNQMLSEMDGFDSDLQVIVMAATNRKDILDPALIRPGRFDRIVYVPLPDYFGRIEILKVHLNKRPYAADIDFHDLAFETTGYSGAQLANLVNMAATVAASAQRTEIQYTDLEKAMEYERLGPERPRYSDVARRRIAGMEAATALTCTLLPAIEPVLTVTIVPREKNPLGQTVVKPDEGREMTGLWTRRYLEQQLLTVLSGRAAEELIYGVDEMSSLHQLRLADARQIVSKLVVSAAMTENAAIGPRTVSVPRPVGAGLMQAITQNVPPALHYAADTEMEKILQASYEDVKAMLARNRDALDRIIEALLEKDTLDGDEVLAIVEAHACKEDLESRAEATREMAFM
ncbi:hypothetical protein D9Q98_005374 [Chlorella vulgaris]|uniref:AAA+ ATPase domain-containing protein n=1 Tax=Chlorella vulgaris TaxID=3077 RepID=A0A9D4YVW2_CHLVU|nr:hypothetical protein D9Q98_005374 [Chlorella vulgaris]